MGFSLKSMKAEWIANVAAELQKARVDLRNDEALAKALRSQVSEETIGYVVMQIPEQGEDLYTVLVSPELIVHVELSRVDPAAPPIIEFESVRAFQARHRKPGRDLRERLAVAIHLLSQSTT